MVRLLLAVSVVLAHSSALFGTTLFGGRTAVECFFVISGFYMAMVLSRKYSRANGGTWKTFMASRVARLLPVYLVVLAASAGATLMAVARGRSVDFWTTFSELSFTGQVVAVMSNLTLLGQDVLSFSAVGEHGLLLVMMDPLSHPDRGTNLLLVPQAWSVSIELAFYALAPFLLRLSTKALALVGAGSLVIRVALVLVGLNHDPWTYRFFPAELVFFILGAIAFRILGSGSPQPRWLGPVLLAGFLGLALVFGGLTGSYPVLEALTPFAFALAVPYFFYWTKNNKWDRWIGELSYPLYLVHVLVGKVLATVGLPANGPLMTVASLVMAVLLLVVIATPLEKMRQRLIARAILPTKFPLESAGR